MDGVPGKCQQKPRGDSLKKTREELDPNPVHMLYIVVQYVCGRETLDSSIFRSSFRREYMNALRSSNMAGWKSHVSMEVSSSEHQL